MPRGNRYVHILMIQRNDILLSTIQRTYFGSQSLKIGRHGDQHEQETYAAVHWKPMAPTLRKAFKKARGQKFSDSDRLQHIYEE